MKLELFKTLSNSESALFETNTINGNAIPYIYDLSLSMNHIVF
jgi:hypothetical protein